MKNNPLLDTKFLKKLDLNNQKEIFIKIISLNKDEEPIESIEGKATGGSINIDGSSVVRRSCSISLVSTGVNITDVYWGLTTKFKLYIGLINNIDNDYENIIWFPQGVFVITNFNTSLSSNQCMISISGKDKMCLLNGEVGGNFPNPIDFAVERRENSDGSFTDVKIPIFQIIREMIHFYGNEPFHNILIKDLTDRGLELLKYNDGDLYAFLDDNGIYVNITFDGSMTKYTMDGRKVQLQDLTNNELTPIGSTDFKIKLKDGITDKIGYYVSKIEANSTAGYRDVELYWPTEDGLAVNVGDTITSVLDKICSTFGTYEYFYDINGQFIFQKKMTYVNQSWTSVVRTENSTDVIQDKEIKAIDKNSLTNYEYNQLYEENAMLTSKSKYNFSDNILITSFQNTPDFSKIKNNFIIWGKKNSTSSNSEGAPIHLRYAIDEKPKIYTTFAGITYRSYDPEATGEFAKTPNPNDTLTGEPISEDWWDVKDWAELYKLYFGDYPAGILSKYYKKENGAKINLNEIYAPATDNDLMAYTYNGAKIGPYYGSWDNEKEDLYVFDLLSDNTIGYVGHGASCTHPWNSYFDPLYQHGGRAFVYKPIIPTQDSENIYYTKQNWRELIYQMACDYQQYGHDDDYAIRLAKLNPTYKNGQTGYESYYADMLLYWRDIYNPMSEDEDKYYVVKAGHTNKLTDQEKVYYGWNRTYVNDPSALVYWMDFIEDASSFIGKYSVKAIGDRPKIVNNDAIKSIIYRDTPNIIYINPEKYELYKKQNMLQDGYAYMPLSSIYEDKFNITSQSKTAYTELNDLLYQYAYMNEKISLKAIPIYYLEPNSIITVDDNKSDIHGEYILNKISLQLTYNGTMTITATKAPPRLL